MKKVLKGLSFVLALILLFSCSSYALTADVKPPATAQDTHEKWILPMGTDYKNAPSIPTLSGKYIYCMSGRRIHKIDRETGKVIGSADMSGRPTYAYVPVTVADGKVFCPVGDGIIEAFDAETLNKLWTSTDALGGQAMTPIVYHGGKIFTGFWNSDTADADFNCIDALSGKIIWSLKRAGGYYWSKCAVKGGYVIVGGDDGSDDFDADSYISCVKISDGTVTDTADITGDMRSGIALDGEDIYLVTKGAYLYKTSINSSGKFGKLKSAALAGYSTSTPAIYDGKIYIGMTGETRNEGFAGMFDADSLEELSRVETPGFPQSEMLIASGYKNPVIYSTYNKGPGGLLAITVSGGKLTYEEIYTPPEGMRGYCISTVQTDENGDLYYKNDSGTVFALTANASPEEPKEPAERTVFDIIRDFFRSVADFFRNLFSFVSA